MISVCSLSFHMLIQSKEKCRCWCGSVIHFQSLFPEKVSIVFTKSSSSALLFYLLRRVKAHCSYLEYASASVGVSYFSLASLQFLYIELENQFQCLYSEDLTTSLQYLKHHAEKFKPIERTCIFFHFIHCQLPFTYILHHYFTI